MVHEIEISAVHSNQQSRKANITKEDMLWVAEFFSGCWECRFQSSFCSHSSLARRSETTVPRARRRGTELVDRCQLAETWRGARLNPLETFMSLGTIVLIILIIILVGGFSGVGGGPFYGTGYYGGGGLGLILVIVLILVLLGRI